MSPEQREQFIAVLKTDLWPTPVASNNDNEAAYLDRLTRLGFSTSPVTTIPDATPADKEG